MTAQPQRRPGGLEFGARVAVDGNDESLKTFAHMAVGQVGAAGLDTATSRTRNWTWRRRSQVPRWRESDVFTRWSATCWSTPRP